MTALLEPEDHVLEPMIEAPPNREEELKAIIRNLEGEIKGLKTRLLTVDPQPMKNVYRGSLEDW